MKFKELSIENFLTVGNIKANLDDKGLVLVCGENLDDTSQDSNGSGKSSFVDALCWALFGVTARDVSGDDVINDRAGKNCKVSVQVETPDGLFTIARHRKYTKHRNRLHLHGPTGDLTLGTDKLTQELVDKLVGDTVDVFCASVYAGQENMPDLPGMGDRELKAIVEESAGIKDIEAGYREARDRLNSEKKSLDDVLRDVEFNTRRAEELANDLDDAATNSASWVEKHDLDVARKKTEVAEFKKRQTVHINVATHARAGSDIQVEIDECDAKIAAQQSERDELERLRSELSTANLSLTNLHNEINSYKGKIAKMKADRQRLSERIGSPCGECGRDHDESTLGAADHSLKKNLKESLLHVKTLQASILEATEASEKASERVSDFKASMTNVSDVLTKQRELRAELSEVSKLKSNVEAATRNFKVAAAAYVKIRDEENPYEAILTTVRERIDRNTVKADDLKEMVKAGEYRVNVAEEVAGVFSPAGVRAHILDNVTPYLNDRTSHYLSSLSDGNITAVWNTLGTTAKGEVREKFNIEVESATGGNKFKKLSGGEKRKVRLAAAMALQDLVASRATKPINLFIADEVDAALDEAGLERLMTLLRDKATDVGSVLVISHSDLKSWISNSVTVVKEHGQARLEGGAL